MVRLAPSRTGTDAPATTWRRSCMCAATSSLFSSPTTADRCRFWQLAPAGSNTDAALVFEAQVGERMMVSDESWRVQRLPGTHAGEGVPVEIVDAREVPRG